jgi:hypothetical protein
MPQIGQAAFFGCGWRPRYDYPEEISFRDSPEWDNFHAYLRRLWFSRN